MVAWSSLADAPAITLHGERLASAIVKRVKPLENREFKINGWVWIHAAKAKDHNHHAAIVGAHTTECPENPALCGCIIGAAHFCKQISVDDAAADERLRPWTFGPKCSLIDDAIILDTPVPARGSLSLWTKYLPYGELRVAFQKTARASAAQQLRLSKTKVDEATRVAIRAALRHANDLR